VGQIKLPNWASSEYRNHHFPASPVQLGCDARPTVGEFQGDALNRIAQVDILVPSRWRSQK
jgi:hypothetical protein